MPSANVTQLPIVVGARLSNVFMQYGGKIYDIELLVPKVRVINVTDKTAQELDTGLTDYLTARARIIDIKYKTNSTVVVRALYIKSGYVVIVRYEIDLSAMTVTVTEETSYNLTWISAWEEISHSAVIPPYLWVAPNKEDSKVHVVNLDDGSDVVFDTFGDSYFVRPSTKYVALNDDIYMMLGRHLSGTGVYLLKLYSHSVVDKGISVGEADARVQIGSITLFYNDVIFPCGGGGVSGSDNDIVLCDHRCNHLGTLDLSALTGWNDVDTMPGFTILAKKTDGNYYALLAVRHSTGSSSPEGRLYWLELQRNGTIVSSQLLHSFAMDDGDKFAVQIKGDYSDRTCVPCIDLRSKKVYTTAYDVEGGTAKGWLVEIDISDVWDNIAEWNRALWFISPLRIPTTLTLSITPL